MDLPSVEHSVENLVLQMAARKALLTVDCSVDSWEYRKAVDWVELKDK